MSLKRQKDLYGFSFAYSGNSWPWASHELAAFQCFWTHWGSKDQSPEFMWGLVRTPFRTQVTLKSLFALISKIIRFSFKKAKTKPWLPGSWSGRLLCAWPQTGCCSRFCNMWCLVLHQVMDGGFCWFPLGQGLLEPSILRGPYGCRTERNTNLSVASHGLVLGSCWQLQEPLLPQTFAGTRKGGGKEPAQPLCAQWAQCFLWRSLHTPSFPFFPFKSCFF